MSTTPTPLFNLVIACCPESPWWRAAEIFGQMASSIVFCTSEESLFAPDALPSADAVLMTATFHQSMQKKGADDALLCADDCVVFIALSEDAPCESLTCQAIECKRMDHMTSMLSDVFDDFFLLSESPICLRLRLSTRIQAHLNLLFFNRLTTDFVSGLPNQKSFKNHIRMRYQGDLGPPHPFTLFVCRINNFREFVFNNGQEIGDIVFCEIGQKIKKELFVRDYIAVSDEQSFAVVVDGDLSDDDAILITGRLGKALSSSIFCSNLKTYQVDVSIGVAHSRNSPLAAEHLLDDAELSVRAVQRALNPLAI